MRPQYHFPEYDRRIPGNVGTHSFFSMLNNVNTQY